MNKKFILGIIVFGFILLSCKEVSWKDIINLQNAAIPVVHPDEDKSSVSVKDLSFYLPSSTTSQIVKHDYFTLSYNENAEQAEWVAYELKKSYIKNNDFKRPYFIEDPKVITKSADWRNYKKSGFDKGHLCPAADMEFDINAYNDTFYTSNISPQNHDFNAGIWNRLEQKIRFWAVKNDGLIVVTGGVLKGSSKSIGTEKVIVPNHFYKILLSPSKGNYKMLAFLVPNEKSSKAIFNYVVSVDELETMTGIDFFPKLEDKTENELEKRVNLNSWLAK